MNTPEPPSVELLAGLPAQVFAHIALQAEQIQRLTIRLAELEAKLHQNSSKSSKPPSRKQP